jgi:hypothetical protein
MTRIVTIMLGEDAYAVRWLNTGQVRELVPILRSFSEPGLSGLDQLELGHRMAALVFARSSPPIVLDQLECTPLELVQGVNAVLEASGFTPSGEAKAASTT